VVGVDGCELGGGGGGGRGRGEESELPSKPNF